jgi:hypothetical protein
MPARLPQLTGPALAASASSPDRSTMDRSTEQARTRAALAASLVSGRCVATVVSGLTGDEITVQAKCKAKIDGAWKYVEFDQADAIFLDVPAADGPGGYQIGTFYPRGGKAGLFFYNTGVDRGRVEAARHVLLTAVGQPDRDDEILAGRTCTRCGRELRRKDSILDRVGPECGRKVQPYLNSHQAPGETFFPDVDPYQAMQDAGAREDWPEVNRRAEQLTQIEVDRLGAAAVTPTQKDIEGLKAAVRAADPPELAEAASEPARGSGEQLILVPAGTDPREVLRGLG